MVSMCDICNKEVEPSAHILFEFCFAVNIWKEVTRKFGILVLPTTRDDLL